MVESVRAATDTLFHLALTNEQDTVEFAQLMAQVYDERCGSDTGLIIYLQGDLGAGKSFFSRAFIHAFLPNEKVKSPTYTIVESYQADQCAPPLVIHHFDLYRVHDPEELEYLAIRDLFVDRYVALIEWPQKGAPILPKADILIEIKHPESFDDEGRKLEMTGLTAQGQALVTAVDLSMLEN